MTEKQIREKLHLGELEEAVLEVLWDHGPATVKQLRVLLLGQRAVSHNSLQASVERLCRKGLLDRTKVSHAYVYEARCQRREVLGELVGNILERLGTPDREPALAAFVDLVEREGEDSLRRLEAMVGERLRQCREGEEDR